jgi:hypothetical protein
MRSTRVACARAGRASWQRCARRRGRLAARCRRRCRPMRRGLTRKAMPKARRCCAGSIRACLPSLAMSCAGAMAGRRARWASAARARARCCPAEELRSRLRLVRRCTRTRAPLILKANRISNVHRRVPLDLFLVPDPRWQGGGDGVVDPCRGVDQRRAGRAQPATCPACARSSTLTMQGLRLQIRAITMARRWSTR